MTPTDWLALALSVGFFQVTPGGYSTRLTGPFNAACVSARDELVYYSKTVSAIMWIAFSGTIGVATAIFFNNNADKGIYVPFIIFSFLNVGFRWLWLDTQRDYDAPQLTIMSGCCLFATTGVTLGLMLSEFDTNVEACILMIIWQAMAFRVLYITYNIWDVRNAMLEKGLLPFHVFKNLGYSNCPYTPENQRSNMGEQKYDTYSQDPESRYGEPEKDRGARSSRQLEAPPYDDRSRTTAATTTTTTATTARGGGFDGGTSRQSNTRYSDFTGGSLRL
jgi:hypothetical protein